MRHKAHQRRRIIQNLTSRCKLIRATFGNVYTNPPDFKSGRFHVRRSCRPAVPLPAPLTICCLKASRSRRAVAYACRSANRSGSVSWCRSANVANSRSPNSNRSPKRWIANRYFPLPSGACCYGPRITIIIPSATCCSTRCRLCCAGQTGQRRANVVLVCDGTGTSAGYQQP